MALASTRSSTKTTSCSVLSAVNAYDSTLCGVDALYSILDDHTASTQVATLEGYYAQHALPAFVQVAVAHALVEGSAYTELQSLLTLLRQRISDEVADKEGYAMKTTEEQLNLQATQKSLCDVEGVL
uniref:DUF7760 domain-containing protein n=1 Tax=Lygus hesperus TaxID=30085 RepID=A0A146LEK9_LYGHE